MPRPRIKEREGSSGPAPICFNGAMGSFQNTATGHHDLEPFWPSRQHHDFDRVCCRALNARAL
ncbi:hypothetical protein CP982_12930 [Streptomyces spectabilis]|uniref:Uncharacterized protein n=1 Tax=Streptomyces spectabilis TaxID=68270 RepID=A0A5P2X3E1_STRST|nr:hypothetical protein CP982_12930 [Streptomyces spectabilis]